MIYFSDFDAGGGGGGGLPPTPTSYKYYFVEFLTTGNGFIGCSTIKCLDAGGTDHALQSNGGVASAIGYTPLAGWEVTRVNDGNSGTSSTSTASAAGSGVGIQIELAASQPITRIGYGSRHDGSGASEGIKTGNIYGKVNGGDAWTLLRDIDEFGITSDEYREWFLTNEVPTSADWRIYANATQSGGFVVCRELELHDTVGGADISAGATMSASSTASGSAANTIDNNSSTFWQASSQTAWLRASKGAAFTVEEFSWQIHAAPGDGIKDIGVQYLNASGGWSTYWTKRGITWSSADQVQVITRPT